MVAVGWGKVAREVQCEAGEGAQVGKTYLNNMQSSLPASPLMLLVGNHSREGCKLQSCDCRIIQLSCGLIAKDHDHMTSGVLEWPEL